MHRMTARVQTFGIALAFAAAALMAPGMAFADAEANSACCDQQRVSPALLAQAQQRLANDSGIALASEANGSLFPSGAQLGLSTTGEARAIVLRVSFPASEDGSTAAEEIPANETDEDLLNAFNATQDASSPLYPYESIHAYYERSSFGKLDYQAAAIVSYTAKHPRSYYEASGGKELFSESLAGVDDRVDFSQCDANGDGYIDAVYLQFAGACGRWGSTWWPTKSTVDSDSDLGRLDLDGKHVCSIVKFSTREYGAAIGNNLEQTLIHETGHVLGLPDLYSYDMPKGPGTGTFDMMDNNIGDQNGLFKWLLGWITPEDITYVHTSAKGVDVRIGTGAITHYDDPATLDITPYTTDATEQTGGFVAVCSDETILTGNLFCSFYLLQFDHAAGNQTISVSGDSLKGHGIRAFRVQAALNSAQTDFAKSNTNGSAGNQLFEILDPREGGGASEIGSFLHTGALVSPSTQPSSNFGGSQEAGYSGVTFEVVSESDESSRVKFSWTAQSEYREFELTPTGSTTINGFNSLGFSPSWEAEALLSADDAIALVIDDKTYTCSKTPRNFKCYYDGKTLQATIAFNPGDLKSDSNAEIVIQKGFFNLGFDSQGNRRLSEEIHIPLQIANLAEIESSGNYESSSCQYLGNPTTTDVMAGENGGRYFFQATWNLDEREKTLSLLRISEDGKEAENVEIDAGAICSSESGVTLQAVDLGNGTAFLHSTPNATAIEGSPYGRDAWIDLENGEVLAMRDCTQDEQNAEFFAIGDAVAFKDSKIAGEPILITLRLSGNTATEGRAALKLPEKMASAASAGNAGDGYVYAANSGLFDADFTGSVALYPSESVLADAPDAATSSLALTIPSNSVIHDVKVLDGKIYIACNTISDPVLLAKQSQLLVYSIEGNLIDTITVDGASDATVRLKVSDSGMIAWVSYTSNLNSLISSTYEGRIIFIDPRSKDLAELGVAGQCCGAWIANRWIEIDKDIEENASEEHPEVSRHWSLTSEMGAESPSPNPNPGPNNPDAKHASDEKASPSNQTLPETNDGASRAACALLIGVAAAASVAVRARRQPRG